MFLLRRKRIEPTDTIGLCGIDWEGIGLIDGTGEVRARGEGVGGWSCAEGLFGFLFFLVLGGIVGGAVGGGGRRRRRDGGVDVIGG